MIGSAATFAAVLPGLLVAHTIADHWIQTGYQAACKGLPGWPGRTACAAHVATYTLTTSAVTAVLWVVLDLGITPWGCAAGQLVSAVTHYWADRRTTLAALAECAGSGEFYRFGAPRPARDDNPTLGTGAYVLDQSWHWFWLFVAALLIAVTT